MTAGGWAHCGFRYRSHCRRGWQTRDDSPQTARTPPSRPTPLPVILAKARIQSRKRNPLRLWILGRAQDDGRGGRSMSLSPSTAGRSYYRLTRNDPHPSRHPGERRDPWLRRTRRSRAVITRPATMGPGVRRDDGKGRCHKIAPAPATTRPLPSSWRKPGSRAASATPHGSGSWVEPRMTEEVGAICLSTSRSPGHRGWLTRHNPPPPSSRRKPGPRASSAPTRGPESRFGPK